MPNRTKCILLVSVMWGFGPSAAAGGSLASSQGRAVPGKRTHRDLLAEMWLLFGASIIPGPGSRAWLSCEVQMSHCARQVHQGLGLNLMAALQVHEADALRLVRLLDPSGEWSVGWAEMVRLTRLHRGRCTPWTHAAPWQRPHCFWFGILACSAALPPPPPPSPHG
jgi:hypothetical protein